MSLKGCLCCTKDRIEQLHCCEEHLAEVDIGAISDLLTEMSALAIVLVPLVIFLHQMGTDSRLVKDVFTVKDNFAMTASTSNETLNSIAASTAMECAGACSLRPCCQTAVFKQDTEQFGTCSMFSTRETISDDYPEAMSVVLHKNSTDGETSVTCTNRSFFFSLKT